MRALARVLAMERREILNWLREGDEGRLDELWQRADAVRRHAVGDEVHLRGLVELSNHCVRACAYCGIRAPNHALVRYRMTHAEVQACARLAVRLGYGTIVLQGGEDPAITREWMAELIRRIKSETPLAVTLGLGERPDADLAAWREAGADRYLLRFETSNPDLYARIHPPLGKGRDATRCGLPAADCRPPIANRQSQIASHPRIALLRRLMELGYEAGGGIMIGIPGQTCDDLADDILLFRELELDMIGVGPYIPHPATPLGRESEIRNPKSEIDQVPNSELMTYKVLALTRIVCPWANIPSTTALATLNRQRGRELGLARGANVVMPNLTPPQYRALYEIYPAKACLFEPPEDFDAALKRRILALGRTIGTGPGPSRKTPPRGPSRRRGESRCPMRPIGPTGSHSPAGSAVDFIDDARLLSLLEGGPPDAGLVRETIAKSLAKQPLSVEETAALVRAEAPEQVEAIFEAARELKRTVYGNRIVLFAPLYIGNYCVNDCAYCGFHRSNLDAVRRTLTPDEVRQQVEALEDKGHKRLILVFGEHPRYSPQFIADTVRLVYSIRKGHGSIRRVNINAAPLDVEGFRTVKAAGIGTYQIFQETYHHPTYARMHKPGTPKGDYLWRLNGLSRAFEAGCDDMGIGALFGLYDWRFEVLGLVTHALHLQKTYNVGPHTISFPRLRPASGVHLKTGYEVSDADFKRVIAILRLAVPYTGLILTAREPAALRREAMAMGVSQIDAGSRIEIAGYTEVGESQERDREQFELGDTRSLDATMRELLDDGYVPSFCTACYRLGRTGEHFMEFAIPGFIKRFCTPNALSTLMEYLVDYASPQTRVAGEKRIAEELALMPDSPMKSQLLERLERIRSSDDRDLYF